MTNIRRYYKKGQIYFLTHVTYHRKSLLINNFGLLWQSIRSIQTEYPFKNIAWVVLPDHFHILIDPGKNNLSGIMRKIKLSFSVKFRNLNNIQKSRIWQNRFWDHIIRDENDMNRHIDYIHYNPVKHGYTYIPFEWKYSSFHDYVGGGYYSTDWGANKQIKLGDDYGE